MSLFPVSSALVSTRLVMFAFAFVSESGSHFIGHTDLKLECILPSDS